MTKTAQYIILFFIVCLAAILRLWNLGSVPPSPDWDEVALGYNAYSIMQTGRDEYGKFLPVVLQSFNDYKPALYAYLTIPSIAVFDLNVFAVRLPSAIFGILAVIATYFLVIELFNKRQVALFSSFLLAISPWHIQFSRVAFESNIGLAFNIFGLLFFIKCFKKPFYIFLSVLFFSLNFYVYQSEKAFVPFFVICLVLIYRKELFSIVKRYIVLGVVLGILILTPLIISSISNNNTFARFEGVSFLSDITLLLKDNVEKNIRDKDNNDIVGILLDNRRIVYVKTFISGYISHFDLNWLFVQGDFENNRHHAPFMGLLYIVCLPFLLIGIYRLLFLGSKDGINNKSKILLIVWFLLAPIPAAFTANVPHAVRTLNFLPTFQIFIAFGIVSAIFYISKIKYKIMGIKLKYAVASFWVFVFAFNFYYYLNQYFIQQNYYYSYDWQYGYKQLIEYLKPIQKNYRKIVVSNRGSLSQSYMFFLFYLKYDPAEYLSEGGSKAKGFLEEKSFSSFEFRSFNYYEEQGKVLFVGTDQDFPEAFKEIKRINNPNGTLAARVVEKEQDKR